MVDQAEVLSPTSEARLESLAGALLDEVGVELVVVTVRSLEGEELARYTLRRFERARVGARAPDGRGVLLLFAAAEERVRIEVGYSLEGVLPDLFVGYVERDQMAPYFADGLVGEGVEATVELVAERLFEAIRSEDTGWQTSSPAGASTGGSTGESAAGGAGAQRTAPIGGGTDRSPVDPEQRAELGPQPSPREAWETFLEIQRRRIKDPRLGLYDEAAAELLERRPNSDAAQAHLVALYDGTPYEIRRQGDRAVVLFPHDPEYRLAPWFFHRTAGGWRLDGSMYPGVITYNHRNQWRFARRDHPYRFAFTDYRIDGSGFARHRSTEP